MKTISVHRLALLASIFEFALAVCPDRPERLMLSPFLERNEESLGRDLSYVHPDCVESYVPESHAGYLTTDTEKGRHMFFWFFPAAENRSTAPVLLWINGGPASTSMIGLFWENGPMNIVHGNKNINGYEQRKYSWVNHFSMIYVDAPIGIGFSYSESNDELENVTQAHYSEELLSFVEQFFQLFPEFKQRDFYIGGQSYAGKFIPTMAIKLHNKIQTGQSSVNLIGIYLGSPLFNIDALENGYYDHIYGLGAISNKQRVDAKEIVRQKFIKIREGLASGKTYPASMVNMPDIMINGYWNNVVTMEESVNFELFFDLFSQNHRRLRNGIHVGNKVFNLIYDDLYDKLSSDFLLSTSTELGVLMDNYKVLIYNGNYDVAINTVGLENGLFGIPWKHQQQYNTNTSRTTWYMEPSNILYGFYSQTDRFCRVVIHGAGHHAPRDNPKATLTMMKQFIRDGCVHDSIDEEL